MVCIHFSFDNCSLSFVRVCQIFNVEQYQQYHQYQISAKSHKCYMI